MIYYRSIDASWSHTSMLYCKLVGLSTRYVFLGRWQVAKTIIYVEHFKKKTFSAHKLLNYFVKSCKVPTASAHNIAADHQILIE